MPEPPIKEELGPSAGHAPEATPNRAPGMTANQMPEMVAILANAPSEKHESEATAVPIPEPSIKEESELFGQCAPEAPALPFIESESIPAGWRAPEATSQALEVTAAQNLELSSAVPSPSAAEQDPAITTPIIPNPPAAVAREVSSGQRGQKC